MCNKTAIVWFRQDLRLQDNPAFSHACDEGYTIIPVYIRDDESAGTWKNGSAVNWWIHHSLQDLNKTLKHNLVFCRGSADKIILTLVSELGVDAVFWNRCYEPWRIQRDKNLKDQLLSQNIECQSFNGSLLWEPWQIKKSDGTPYKVFTPFYRKGCLQARPPRVPIEAPQNIQFASLDAAKRGRLENLGLLDNHPWHEKLHKYWEPTEAAAHIRLKEFIEQGLKGYKEGRNRPDLRNVSRLSPYLRHGNISPNQAWYAVQKHGMGAGLESDIDTFCSELGWREFSYSLLHYNPDLPQAPLQQKFKDFPWDNPSEKTLEKWHKGQTGIPLVDAGMRQLWETGWMHNRVRMVTASFLIKNMLIHWQEGEKWFWDCLVDADLASNAASWQWVAGSGADAAPYFRIFNPVTQGQKFDPSADYIKKFIPELRNTSKPHEPWKASLETVNYPAPIVDLKLTRERALEAFQSL